MHPDVRRDLALDHDCQSAFKYCRPNDTLYCPELNPSCKRPYSWATEGVRTESANSRVANAKIFSFLIATTDISVAPSAASKPSKCLSDTCSRLTC
jgi:hypothetical protein